MSMSQAPWELLLPGAKSEPLWVLGTIDGHAREALAGRPIHRSPRAAPFTTIVVLPDGPPPSEAEADRLRSYLAPHGYLLWLTRRGGGLVATPLRAELRFLAGHHGLWRPEAGWAAPLGSAGKVDWLRRWLGRASPAPHELRLAANASGLGSAWVFDVLATAGREALPTHAPLELGRIDRTNTGLLLCRARAAEGTVVALKVPSCETARAELEHESRVLEALSRRGLPRTVLASIPPGLAAGVHLGLEYRLERWVAGVPGAQWMYRSAPRERAVEAALDWIVGLHGASRGATLAAGEQARRASAVLAACAARAHREDAGFATTVARYVEEAVARDPIPTVQGHGDYWLGNLVFHDDGGVAAVVDWTWSTPDAPPLEDPLHLLLYLKGWFSAYRPAARLARLLLGRSSPRARRRLARYARVLELPPRAIGALALLWWVRYLETRSDYLPHLREDSDGAYLPVRRAVERLGARGLDDWGPAMMV
jgi:aminoglycoside phosphotransferase (APT) family kinase protein